MHARTWRHVSSAILFPFSFIVALPSLFAEHQHHLLFARSIYSVNYIYLCSRYTAVVLSSVNCAFTFFLLLFYFIFLHLLLFCLFILPVLAYRSQFGIPRGLRFRLILRLVLNAREAHQPIGSVKLSPVHEAVNFRFIRLSFTFPLIARVRVQARNNALLSYQRGAPFFISVLFRRAISHARELYITSLI